MAAVESLQLYEVGMLLLLLIGFVPMTVQYYRYENRWFYSAYILFLVAAVLTNAEAFYEAAILNYAEHLSMLAASFLFWMTAYQSAEAVVNADASDVLHELLGGESGG